jgi:rhodanese-related sulfurtransferase
MKLKQVRRLIASMFPAECGPLFDRCSSGRELQLVADAFVVAGKEISARDLEHMKAEAEHLAAVRLMAHKIDVLEEAVAAREVPLATVRDAQEEVFVVPPPPGQIINDLDPPRPQGLNRIAMYKAVRDINPSMLLKDAKDLVDSVLDKGDKKSVFKGQIERAAAAARILKDAGFHTERKEAI